MDKYTELKNQVEEELKWLIDDINEEYDIGLSENITLVDYIGNKRFEAIPMYHKGMLFAYLSIKSKINSLEEES